MTRTINDVASVRFGAHAKAVKAGSMGLVQSSAVLPNGVLEHAYLAYTDPNIVRVQGKDLLRPGDVLLIGKGPRNTAAVWQGIDRPVIAASMLYVLRPKTDVVLPGYLAGYLNSPMAQMVFATHSKTGTVNVLSRKALDELSIPLPSLDQQQVFVRLAEAAQRELFLLDQLKEQHQQLMRSVWTTFQQR